MIRSRKVWFSHLHVSEIYDSISSRAHVCAADMLSCSNHEVKRLHYDTSPSSLPSHRNHQVDLLNTMVIDTHIQTRYILESWYIQYITTGLTKQGQGTLLGLLPNFWWPTHTLTHRLFQLPHSLWSVSIEVYSLRTYINMPETSLIYIYIIYTFKPCMDCVFSPIPGCICPLLFGNHHLHDRSSNQQPHYIQGWWKGIQTVLK